MIKINIGKENATFQQIVALKENRNKRAATKTFFVEGVQNIKEAISNNWVIDAFIYSNETKLSNWAKSVINNADKNYVLTNSLMCKLSDKENTSELLAIIKMKKFENDNHEENPLYVLLDRPSNKGNLGSIIRSCDVLNVDRIYFTGHAVDIYDHDVIKATMGSFFRMPIYFIDSNENYMKFIVYLKNIYKDFQVVGTSLNTTKYLEECNFKKPTLLLIGNETSGLCKFYLDNADSLVKIKMKNEKDSLNVACATTTCLYEISRQRNNIIVKFNIN